MIRFFKLTLLLIFISSCSRGKLSLYEEGNLHTRVFLSHVSQRDQIQGNYYEVRRNAQKQIVSALHFTAQKSLVEKSYYTYSQNGILLLHRHTEYFHEGPPRVSQEWTYKNSRVIRREEKWFTRSRYLEKKLTILYDEEQKPYLEETWGLGNKIKNSTEYYYDYDHRLDKSRKNFFQSDGSLRDYWLTIYNDQIQITTEEHYLPDNSMLSFYRYAYHPIQGYREREEFLDANRNIFVSKKFDEYGLVLEEEERDRELNLIKRTVYEYNDKHQPQLLHHYDSAGRLLKTSKYKRPRYLDKFRTPGI